MLAAPTASYLLHGGAGDACVVVCTRVAPPRLLLRVRKRALCPVVDEALGTGQHLQGRTTPKRQKPAAGQRHIEPKLRVGSCPWLGPPSPSGANETVRRSSVRQQSAPGSPGRLQRGRQATRAFRKPLRSPTFMCCMRKESLLNRVSLSAASKPSKPAAASSVAMTTAGALSARGSDLQCCRGVIIR